MAGLDHEERFLFREEILALAAALAEGSALDNVEDLLVDLITSSHFDAEVVTLERSLQAMLGQRQGATLVTALTVTPEVFAEAEDLRLPPAQVLVEMLPIKKKRPEVAPGNLVMMMSLILMRKLVVRNQIH